MTFEAPRLEAGERVSYFSEEQMVATAKWLDSEGYEYAILEGYIEVLGDR